MCIRFGHQLRRSAGKTNDLLRLFGLYGFCSNSRRSFVRKIPILGVVSALVAFYWKCAYWVFIYGLHRADSNDEYVLGTSNQTSNAALIKFCAHPDHNFQLARELGSCVSHKVDDDKDLEQRKGVRYLVVIYDERILIWKGGKVASTRTPKVR